MSRCIRIKREEEHRFSSGLSNYRIISTINLSSSLLFFFMYSNDALLVDDSTSCILHLVI